MPVTERPILLTGATGFVGMTVLARLLADGREVLCLVRGADDAEPTPACAPSCSAWTRPRAVAPWPSRAI